MRLSLSCSLLAAAVCLAGCGSVTQNAMQGNAPTVTAVGVQTNGVATNRAIDVEFSTDMNPATINAKTLVVRKANDGAAVSGSVSYDATNRVADFKPTNGFEPSTSYNAVVTTGAADVQGHHLAANYAFTFATRDSSDSSPIGVYSTTPASGATGVDVNSKIKVVFTEGAQSDSVTIATFAVKDSSGAAVSGAVTYDIYNNVAQFYPNAPLQAGMTYTVTIDGVRDLAGVPMTTPYVFSFTTAGSIGGGGNSSGGDLVYESNQYQDQINGWVFDFSSGTLSPASGSPALTDSGPTQLLFSPNHNFLYALMSQLEPTVRGSNCTNAPTEIIAYTVDHASGALSLLQRISLNGTCGKEAMDPAGHFLYVGETDAVESGGKIDVLSLDSNTGRMSLVPGSPFASSGIPWDLTVAGNYLYATDLSYGTTTGLLIYRRDPNTGAVQFQSGYTIVPQNYVAALPDGSRVYSVEANSGTISEFRVDASTGNLTPIGTVPSGHDASEIEADPTGKYVAVPFADGVDVYTVSATGELTPMAGSPFGSGTTGISAMFDSTGTHFAAIQSRDVNIYALTGGTAQMITSATVADYPARVTMATK